MTAEPPTFRSLLYSQPRLYDLVFPDHGATARVVGAAIDRYLTTRPGSILDVGCGTGRLLEALAATIPERTGVDLLETNTAYARSRRAGIRFEAADMRTVRLGRTFDLVTCLGNTLSYALEDADLAATAATFAVHAHAGTLLVVDALNGRAYLESDGFRARIESHVDVPGFKATAVSNHELDREARRLRRTRSWRIADAAEVQDHAEYQLLFPDEMRVLLQTAGFDVLGVYDNREFRPTDLAGSVTAEPDVGGMRGRKLCAFARLGMP